MEIELEPEQPEEVVRAVADLIAEHGTAPDPWWQAGIDDQMEA